MGPSNNGRGTGGSRGSALGGYMEKLQSRLADYVATQLILGLYLEAVLTEICLRI